ncbi:thioesterase domain-containing protein [Labrenzia sp. DG1229]|uniref:thioesterase II family protein n=1 Tax=Labrenzia sp. DG1229 TaxID=681847 RepID=UPI00068F6FD7|nr:thioesterase domain-containing protein [Labrenzia sp. DG1229]
MKSVKLYVFPHAGGTATGMRHWSEIFAPQIELRVVEAPGRDRTYIKAPEMIDVMEMASLLAGDISREQFEAAVTDYAFLGHSLGALLAFETARQMNRSKMKMPVHLFVCGHRAPHLPAKRDIIHNLDDAAFDQALSTLGGTPPEIMESADLLDLIRPTLRRDIRAAEIYNCDNSALLNIPITAFGGSSDSFVTFSEIREWQRWTTNRFSFAMFEGGHFFLEDRLEELANRVSKSLSS